jgi:RND family efflux transporter MFP subunit
MTYTGIDKLWLAVALAASSVAIGCDPSSQANEAEANDAFVKVVNVEVTPIELTDFTAYIRLTGEVEAMNDVVVSAEESGVVEQIFVKKGQYVRKGSPIAKVRDRVLRAQVEEAAAASELAQERFKRQRQLWEEEQIGSEIAFLEARYQAELQKARHQLLQARLDRTTIRSPIAGVFDDRYVDAGEMVAPGAQVARIVAVDRVKVTGGVAERFAVAVSPGDSAVISFDVLGDETVIGTIGYVGSAVDTRNRTFPIEVVIANPGRVIKPHMVANVLIANSRLQDVVVIPQSAVGRTEDGYQVFVAEEGSEALLAKARLVRLGPSYENLVVVEEGLNVGDQLIVRGQQLVEAGDRVRVVNEASAEGGATK